MNRNDQIKLGALCGAVGGFISGALFPCVFYFDHLSSQIRDGDFSDALSVLVYFGICGMFLLGISGAIKGWQGRMNSSISSWVKTGFFTTLIVSLPLIPIVLFGLIYTLSSEYEDYRPELLAILPLTYIAGVFGGFIAGKLYNKYQYRIRVDET